MSVPLVSVIIPVFNAEEHIAEAIDSVLAQTHTNLQIITVDDGSTDASATRIAAYGNAVHYIQQQNGGPASARNTGIRNATGEYIAFLDADDIWLPPKIERQLVDMAADAEIGLSHTGSIVFDGDEDRPFRAKELPPLMEASAAFEQLLFSNFISTSSVVVNRQFLDSVGQFDESRNFFAVEDYDMWLRFACAYKLAYVADPLLRYRAHDAGISRNIDRSYRNERCVLDKWYAENNKCVQRVTFSKNQRYEKLMIDWGDDHLWAGNPKEALRIFRDSACRYGFSARIVKRLLKASLGRLKF